MAFPSYDDIISRIAKSPLWWMEGVPRYEPFSPQRAQIHAYEIALVHTECQSCRTRFDVCIGGRYGGHGQSLEDLLAVSATLHVSDPPNVSCCPYGYSMTSLEIAILQFWRLTDRSYVRIPELELLLDDADEGDRSRPRIPPPAVRLIMHAGLESELNAAITAGDRGAQLNLLRRVGCSRPEEVVNMWEKNRASNPKRIASLPDE